MCVYTFPSASIVTNAYECPFISVDLQYIYVDFVPLDLEHLVVIINSFPYVLTFQVFGGINSVI